MKLSQVRMIRPIWEQIISRMKLSTVLIFKFFVYRIAPFWLCPITLHKHATFSYVTFYEKFQVEVGFQVLFCFVLFFFLFSFFFFFFFFLPKPKYIFSL